MKRERMFGYLWYDQRKNIFHILSLDQHVRSMLYSGDWIYIGEFD